MQLNKTPKYCYRFYSSNRVNHLLEVLKENSLYFAFPSQFSSNDAFDCKSFHFTASTQKEYDIICKQYVEVNYSNKSIDEKRTLLARRINDYGGIHDFTNNCAQSIANVYKRNWDVLRFAILCMSLNTTKKMWKLYAQNSEGFCLKLNVHLITSFLNQISISKINNYSNYFMFKRVTYPKGFINIPYSDFDEKDPLELAYIMLFSKRRKEYSFEHEFRILIPECIHQKIVFPHNLIEEIKIGKNASDDQVKQIIETNKLRQIPAKIKKYTD